MTTKNRNSRLTTFLGKWRFLSIEIQKMKERRETYIRHPMNLALTMQSSERIVHLEKQKLDLIRELD